MFYSMAVGLLVMPEKCYKSWLHTCMEAALLAMPEKCYKSWLKQCEKGSAPGYAREVLQVLKSWLNTCERGGALGDA